ncbi:cold shock domain-containing protein [Marinobacter apostichopi]|uniref:cold shock domain-containing protein n=1 Tax=Marinobacter apostichopi TaxID=3035454 RepID=UPI002572983B|nr:cold shock domain-containing protein [Marinobacter sp. LA51]
MPRGKVKWFNNAKGYGFIIEDGCSDDLFAHFSSVQMDGYKTLKAGQPVTFDKKPSDKGVHAINIVPDAQPQKATQELADASAGAKTDDPDPGRSDFPSRAANA